MTQSDQYLWRGVFVPAPCDACRLRQRCADRQLACAAYASFFDGAGMSRWMAAPRAPTREIFDALLAPGRDPSSRRPKTLRGMRYAAGAGTVGITGVMTGVIRGAGG